MTILKREEWHDITRLTDWEFTYVDHQTVFPDWMSGGQGTDPAAWSVWREDYRNSYGEYVATQREKDQAAFAVKAALQRSDIYDNLPEGSKTNSKVHFSLFTHPESIAVPGELRMARFGLTGGWRNMATLGAMDEMRHAQINLWFAHELVAKDVQYDWTVKSLFTDNWVAVAARAFLDGFIATTSAVDIAIALPFTFETGFSNLQFVALAANALDSGDVNFANMISSIQTDEARHAQQGGPTLEVLIDQHGKERAQWIIDKTFWLTSRIFAIATGPSMDYYTPLEGREQSYKEFMAEWIGEQFITSLEDYGLRKPWFWGEFIDGLDHAHHSLHLGTWFYRWTLFWNPSGGLSEAERSWLCEKYPDWEENFGHYWDVIIHDINDGRPYLTLPGALPWVCNMCQLPLATSTSPASAKYPARPGFKLVHNNYSYWFCSEPCRRIWWEDRSTIKHQRTIVQRMLDGSVQPPDLTGLFNYMALGSDEMGDDAYGMGWASDYAH